MVNDKGLAASIEREVYSTGCDVLDYENGKINRDGSRIVGVSGGKILTIVGKSGSGKSTLAIQIGGYIVSLSEDGQMFIYDAEKAHSHERAATLLGYDYETYKAEIEDKKVFIRNLNTTTEGLIGLIVEIHKAKMEHFAGTTFTKTEGRKRGTELQEKKARKAAADMPPTVILADSWPKINPEKIDEDEDKASNMAGGQAAKAKNELVRNMLERMYEANIILIIVNHIGKSISTERYVVDDRPLKWLKMGENLPGGKDHVYLSDCAIRLEQKKALVANEEFGITGFLNEATILKSRSNASGRTVQLVFDQFTGIDNLYTNYLNLKLAKVIEGSSSSFKLKSYPEKTFSQKGLRALYDSDKKFKKAFDKAVADLLSDRLSRLGLEGNAIEADDDDGGSISEEEIRAMSKKQFKDFVTANDITIDWSEYDTLDEAKTAVIESLSGDDEE